MLVETGSYAIALETEQILRDLIRELGDVFRFTKIINDPDRRDAFEIDDACFDVDPVLDGSEGADDQTLSGKVLPPNHRGRPAQRLTRIEAELHQPAVARLEVNDAVARGLEVARDRFLERAAFPVLRRLAAHVLKRQHERSDAR